MSNERLEFLGDAVLGLVVTDYVFAEYPDLPEGELPKLRASVVNAEVLAEVAGSWISARHLLLGKGEDATGGREAVHPRRRHGGRDRRRLPRRRVGRGPQARPALLEERIAEGAAGPGGHDYKTRLQELAAQTFDQLPPLPGAPRGPDHSKRFFATVSSRDELRRGRGSIEEAGRAGGRARLALPRSRGLAQRVRTRRRRSSGGRCRSCLRSKSLRRDLEREIVGKKIKAVEVDGMRCDRRHHNRKQFANRLVGQEDHRPSSGAASTSGAGSTARGARDPPRDVGQLLRAKGTRETTAKHTHVVITFTQGGQLRFIDPRTFGEMFVTELDGVEKQVPELSHLGIDPLEDAMSWDNFGRLLAERST